MRITYPLRFEAVCISVPNVRHCAKKLIWRCCASNIRVFVSVEYCKLAQWKKIARIIIRSDGLTSVKD